MPSKLKLCRKAIRNIAPKCHIIAVVAQPHHLYSRLTNAPSEYPERVTEAMLRRELESRPHYLRAPKKKTGQRQVVLSWQWW